jgi:ribosomal protein S18 acetylase RimI-like enzyme
MNDDTHVLLRPATDADVADVARIWHAGWADGHLGNVPDALVAERTREEFLQRTPSRIPATTVALADGSLVGFVMVIDDELEQIYVDAAARGSGVASRLIAHAEQTIAAAGYSTAWLAVVAGNGRARAFYERQGWSDAGPIDYLAETSQGSLVVPSHRYETSVRSTA